MEVTGAPPVATGATRRSGIAGLVSIGIHGGALLALALLVHDHLAEEARPVELTMIQVVEPPAPPPPPPPAAAGTTLRSTANTSTGTLGRRGRDAPQRSQTRAPATDPYADVVMSYERPTGPDPGNEAGPGGVGIGGGLIGDGTGSGTGGGQFGLGNIPVPPPPPSLARAARPRHEYRNWDFHAQPRFAGAIVRLMLRIDPTGHVRDVQIVQGVDPSIDDRAVGLARRFEFYPALDDAGRPTWGLHNWEFVLPGGRDLPFQPRL